jgi:hypothetical protein
MALQCSVLRRLFRRLAVRDRGRGIIDGEVGDVVARDVRRHLVPAGAADGLISSLPGISIEGMCAGRADPDLLVANLSEIGSACRDQ